MNEINIEKINELLESVSTPEEVQSVLAQNGIEITVAEIKDMIKKHESELSAEDLDDVAGGCIRPRRVRFKIIRVPFPPYILIIPVYY